MKGLRLYHLVKGDQSKINIGDNIKDFMKDKTDFFDFQRLDESFKTEFFVDELITSLKIKKELRSEKMIDSCMYICNESGTIKGMIPINVKG